MARTLKDLRRGTAISRNRDMAWERLLAKNRPSGASASTCTGA